MIKINCPACNAPLSVFKDKMICKEDHEFKAINKVYRLFEKEEMKKFDNYLEKFEDFRKLSFQQINEENIDKLPFVDFDNEIWKLRRIDLSLIWDIIEAKENLAILDIGAWNCWLSNNLSKLGHHVTAMDYFRAAFDGLESIAYLKEDILGIQTSIDNLKLIQTKFDLIILNRGLPYLSDLQVQIQQIISMLQDGGTLIIIGINKISNPELMIDHNKKLDQKFIKTYGTSIFFDKAKGYVDSEDMAFLRQIGFKIKRYRKLIHKSFLSKIGIGKVDYLYAIYKN